MTLPRMVLHNAISLDGRTTGFPVDLCLFYGLVSRWNEDATLTGSETILASGVTPDDAGEPAPPWKAQPGDRRPLLVVPDSRGRIRSWNHLRSEPYWRDVLVLCTRSTPQEYLAYLDQSSVPYLIRGETQVDLPGALAELYDRYGVRLVRVDSGGTLNGLLLEAGLVDELSLLVHPCLVGGPSPNPLFRPPDGAAPEGDPLPAKLTHLERLADDVVWLRYDVTK